MKKITVVLLVLVAAFAILSTGAHASAMDTVVITGTYDSSASSTAFSGPSGTFTLSFSLPTTLDSLLVDTGIQVTIGFGGSTTMLTGSMQFFTSGGGGGLNVDVTNIGVPLEHFEWQIFAPQLFDSSNNLLLGNFSMATGSQLAVAGDTDTDATITGGTIAISPAPSGATPEPSSLILLGTGLLGLGALVRRGLA